MNNNLVNIGVEKIIRSKRKTIALQITDDGTLIVRTPFAADRETIMAVILKHKRWIDKKKREIEARNPKFSSREFANGEDFLYLGKYYKLEIPNEQKVPLIFYDGFYLSKEALPQAREVFIEWYKKAAYEKILERVELYLQKTRLKYKEVKITNAQKRWGSCSHSGNLNFPWRLVMAPLPVIDYIVIHELVHLKVKNHKRTFWTKVKELMPDYEKFEDWLKKNSYLLKL